LASARANDGSPPNAPFPSIRARSGLRQSSAFVDQRSIDQAALAEPAAFEAHLAALRKVEWVVYAKRPFGGPGAVLAYLSPLHAPDRYRQEPARHLRRRAREFQMEGLPGQLPSLPRAEFDANRPIGVIELGLFGGGEIPVADDVEVRRGFVDDGAPLPLEIKPSNRPDLPIAAQQPLALEQRVSSDNDRLERASAARRSSPLPHGLSNFKKKTPPESPLK
jgi:hypothetical protein